ncbi:hypothetical protein AMQ83_28730 [Paenibacillus riograndensis]|nr:hypothetical protein AMQ83_28730 [Paenibacillus riograndensis]
MAWQQWLTQAPVSGGAAGADNYVRTIGANSTDYYIALETTIANGLTAAGIMDFVAVGNTSGSIRPLRVKVYAYKNAPVFSPGSPAAIAVPYQTLGSDSSWFGSVAGQTVYYGYYGFESVVRGTFQHCTRTATVNWNSTSGSRFLELFTRHTSVFVNPNEFEAGTDVTQPSGSQTVYSPYGSDFKITFVLTDGAHKNTIYGYLQNLKDTSYVIVKHGTGSSGYGSVGPGSAWNYDITNLNGGTTTIQIWTTAIGGFSGTQQMYWA